MGEHWSLESVHHLRELALEKVPVPVIAMTMRRGVGEVHSKLAELGLSAPMGEDDEPSGEAGQSTPPQPAPGSASF